MIPPQIDAATPAALGGRLRGFLTAGGYDLISGVYARVIAHDTVLLAKPLLFHWTVLVSDLDNPLQYHDRWCFKDSTLAVAAVRNWPFDPPAGYEPQGWHKHPPSGRRNPPDPFERAHT